MSHNRNQALDRRNTLARLQNPTPEAGTRNWLGHGLRTGAACIDNMLLTGATLDQMRINSRRASNQSVLSQIQHLRNTHGLPISEINGIYRYDFPGARNTPESDATTVIPKSAVTPLPTYTVSEESAEPLRASSESLQPGQVYTREQLRVMFDITDATLNNGVFRPKGHRSVWLFITEEKSSDRTAYIDQLDGNTLYFQGQTEGRTDQIIIKHEQRGLELLLFYRRSKIEYSGAGFRYEGCFRYVNHSGFRPTSFVLDRIKTKLDQAAAEAEQAGAFDPSSIEDAREKVSAAIVRRQGQPAFRRALLAAYASRCAITGCDVPEALEAAHIHPYKGEHTNHITNGLLLRADLHTLFDLGLIAVDPKRLTVVIAPALLKTDYKDLAGKELRQPLNPNQHPSSEALRLHLNQSKAKP